MFGMTTTTGDQAAHSDARFLIELAKLMVDPQAVSARLEKLHEEGKRIEAARAAHDQRERVLQDREARVSKRESQAAEAESRAEERERTAQRAAARAEEQKAELAALKAEVRKNLQAASCLATPISRRPPAGSTARSPRSISRGAATRTRWRCSRLSCGSATSGSIRCASAWPRSTSLSARRARW